MSDSLPPDEGPDPYEGQDLEGLLSGNGEPFPVGLRPVAHTLDALRAAPMRGELGGEAAARADFRRLMLGAGNGAWSSDSSGERTLILPVEAAGVGRRPLQGRHRRRRPVRRGQWQAKALAGVAAAAVVVVGVAALTGTFSGSGGLSGRSGSSPSASSASSRATAPPLNGVEGSATRAPTHSASPTAAKQPSELCREYWAPEYPLSQQDHNALFQQLSDLAGGQGNVYPYCLQFLQPWDAGSKDQGNQSSRGIDWPSRHNGDGNGNGNRNGNGSGRGDSGSGDQNQNQNQQ